MKKILMAKKFFILELFIMLLLTTFVLYTPKAVDSKVETKFSAVRAQAHIKEISKEPHSYYDQVELANVRSYIIDTLNTNLGASNVSEVRYEKEFVKQELNELVPYDIVNVLGKLPGKSDKGILLVAHYDSRDHVGRYGELGRSYGAMDDGYGVSSMLELSYILKDLNPENSIYFLFTDAEEVGLYGAKLAATDKTLMDNVRFVINLESRGRYGPSYMFETSKNNHKVIDLYKKAKLPVTYSMATAVYSVMPNFTDFSPFIDRGLPGINFATLAGLDNYHSPLDSYENINISSIQHMGVQVEPVVREFISNSKYVEDNYFVSNSDQVFFTIFAGVLISYSNTVAIILLIVAIIFTILLFTFLALDKGFSINIVKSTLPKGLLLAFVLIISGYIFSNIIAFIGKVPFNITYTRVLSSLSDIPSLIFLVVIVLIYTVYISKSKLNDILTIGITLNLLLTLITTIFLPGASFLFLTATMFGIIGISMDKISNKITKKAILLFSILFQLLIIIPLLYSFYHALTIGGIMVLVILIVINGLVTIPLVLKNLNLGGENERK